VSPVLTCPEHARRAAPALRVLPECQGHGSPPRIKCPHETRGNQASPGPWPNRRSLWRLSLEWKRPAGRAQAALANPPPATRRRSAWPPWTVIGPMGQVEGKALPAHQPRPNRWFPDPWPQSGDTLPAALGRAWLRLPRPGLRPGPFWLRIPRLGSGAVGAIHQLERRLPFRRQPQRLHFRNGARPAEHLASARSTRSPARRDCVRRHRFTEPLLCAAGMPSALPQPCLAWGPAYSRTTVPCPPEGTPATVPGHR